MDYVEVIDDVDGQRYFFPCNKWFDKSEGDGLIERVLEVGRAGGLVCTCVPGTCGPSTTHMRTHACLHTQTHAGGCAGPGRPEGHVQDHGAHLGVCVGCTRLGLRKRCH